MAGNGSYLCVPNLTMTVLLSAGHQVSLHQDAAFFEFGGSNLSPIGTLNYCVDTNITPLNNGPLTVFPVSIASTCSHAFMRVQVFACIYTLCVRSVVPSALTTV